MAEPSEDNDAGHGGVTDRPTFPSSSEETQPLAHNDNAVIISDDENNDDASASYCSTTSAESLLDDDIENQQQDDDIENGDTIGQSSAAQRRTVRTPSFSYDELARRPRSNPRTRTPLRNPSPLLGTVTRATIHDDDDDNGHVIAGANVGTNAVTGTSSHVVTPGERRTAANPTQRMSTNIRLNAGLRVGTTVGRYATGNNGASSHRAGAIAGAAAAQRSSKQGPSHRKLRRWNNDNMIGIVSDIISAAHHRSNSRSGDDRSRRARSLRAADAFARGEAERMEYVMPNYPLSYRSAFDELTRVHAVDTFDDNGDSHGVDDGDTTVGGIDENREERRRHQSSEHAAAQAARRRNIDLLVVRERFLRGENGRDEILVPNPAKKRANNTSSNFIDVPSGEELFNRMEPRIRNVVQRAVISSSFAVRVMNAYEDVLVNRRMASTESSTVLEEILVRPVVAKEEKTKSKTEKKKSKKSSSRTEGENKEVGISAGGSKVGRMVFHFHFNPEGTNAGFHRLLLHAVCQFHRMNASSTTVVNRKGDDGGGDGTPKKERVVTVTGTCQGRQHSIVEQATQVETINAERCMYSESNE